MTVSAVAKQATLVALCGMAIELSIEMSRDDVKIHSVQIDILSKSRLGWLVVASSSHDSY